MNRLAGHKASNPLDRQHGENRKRNLGIDNQCRDSLPAPHETIEKQARAERQRQNRIPARIGKKLPDKTGNLLENLHILPTLL